MKKILFLLVLASLIIPVVEARDVRVNGGYRSDGTYVQPHYRTSPNSTQSDNWGTKGNTNPYTGAPGTKNDNSYNPWSLKGLR
jgi:hypothetical protein